MEAKKTEYVRLSVRLEADTRERVYQRAEKMGVRPSAYAQIAFAIGDQILWNTVRGDVSGKTGD